MTAPGPDPGRNSDTGEIAVAQELRATLRDRRESCLRVTLALICLAVTINIIMILAVAMLAAYWLGRLR